MKAVISRYIMDARLSEEWAILGDLKEKGGETAKEELD